MRTLVIMGIGTLCALLFTESAVQGQTVIQRQNAFHRDSITILITDSGLGGLSVCAELEKRLEGLRTFRKVKLIFANALPDAAHPYNALPDKKEQLRVFDTALEAMHRAFHPDVILIACNTLSVLYPETQFARTASIQVNSIVEAGARALATTMKKHNAAAIIFGTETTIRSGAYQRLLTASGCSSDRISVQSCPQLEGEIQADPKSDIVSNLIELYTTEALEKRKKKEGGAVVAGLCCSHYGYSAELFRQSLQHQLVHEYYLVNPNDAMVESFFESFPLRMWESTVIVVDVVSRVPFSPEEVYSISTAIAAVSQKTAAALRGYRCDKTLFPFPSN